MSLSLILALLPCLAIAGDPNDSNNQASSSSAPRATVTLEEFRIDAAAIARLMYPLEFESKCPESLLSICRSRSTSRNVMQRMIQISSLIDNQVPQSHEFYLKILQQFHAAEGATDDAIIQAILHYYTDLEPLQRIPFLATYIEYIRGALERVSSTRFERRYGAMPLFFVFLLIYLSWQAFNNLENHSY